MAATSRLFARLPSVVLCIAVAVAALPFFLLSYYNHPFLDDYYNAANVRTTGLLAQQIDLYLHWTGRFSTSWIVTAANPLVYNWYDGFRLTPALTLFATLGVVYLGLRTLSQSLPRGQALLAATVFLLLYLHILPDSYQAIYWFTGAVVYHGAGLFLLLVFVASARAQQAVRSGWRLAWRVVAMVCTVAAAGANEMTMMHLLLVLALLLGVSWYRRQWPQMCWWAFLLALALVASAVTVLAPGNFVRMKTDGYAKDPSSANLLRQVLTAVPGTFDIVEHLLGGYEFPFRLGLPLLVWVPTVLYWQRRGWLSGTVRLPWYGAALVLVAGLVFSAFLFKAIMGSTPPARVINGLLFFLLPLELLMVWAALAYHEPRFAVRLPGWLWRWSLVAFVVGFGMMGIPLRAWQELLRSAPAYDEQLLAREEEMRAAKSKGTENLVVLPLYGIKPHWVMITDWDLTTDPWHYVNTETALYFGVKTIVINKEYIPAAHPDFHYQ
ncbi:DUF6056 family protein [uncultured Hymenobacter sp.]|uniref:DUF6056 family protein n=1 Tax=uncultured Hymenobacter sp. TaxID=170016 RepID=UPI0035CA25A0